MRSDSRSCSQVSAPPLRRSASGQAFTEFAIAVPLLILLVLAMVDFGRVVVDFTALSNAARQGAQYAATAGLSSLACSPSAGTCPPDLLSNTMATAPQVSGGDVMSMTLRSSVVSLPEANPGDSPNAYYYQWQLTLVSRFHPITTMFLGGATISISVQAHYVKSSRNVSG